MTRSPDVRAGARAPLVPRAWPVAATSPGTPVRPSLPRSDPEEPHATEVNVTSPTGIREIDALTGSHLADDMISWAEDRCRAMTRTA